MTESSRNPLTGRDILIALLFSLSALALAYRPIFAVDTFWHLALGHIISTVGIPTTDLFSAVHPDSNWVQFQWLWEWGAFELVNWGGLGALRMTHALLLSGTFGGAYLVFRKRLCREEAAFVVAALFLLCVDRFRVRPDALNIVFFVAGLPYLLWGWRQWKAARFVFPLALAVLWSNLHGGGVLLWIVSVGTIWTHQLVSWRRQEIPLKRLGEATAILSMVILGSIASPTFLPGLTKFIGIFGAATQEIPNPEWNVTLSMIFEGDHPQYKLVGLLPYGIGAFFLWVLGTRLRGESSRRKPELQECLLALGFLYLSHHWVRTAFLAVVALALALEWLPPSRVRRIWLLLGVGLLWVIPVHQHTLAARGSLAETLAVGELDLEPTVFPVAAANFMERASLKGKVLNEGKWGGYLIWRTWPQNTYFFDTRHNMTADMWPLLRSSLSLPSRTAAMNRGFEEYGLELAVFRNGGEPFDRPPEGWALLFKAGPQVIYQHLKGENAGGNIQRAQRETGPEMTATEYGGERWLNEPWRKRKMQESQGAVADPYMKGRRLHRAGDYAGAATEFEKVLGKPNASPFIHHWLAAALAGAGEKDKARAQLSHGQVPPEAVPILLRRDLSVLALP